MLSWISRAARTPVICPTVLPGNAHVVAVAGAPEQSAFTEVNWV
ncbi:MAG: hypothetical protein ABIP65_03230 [Vicinamibacterales bacterium]